MLAKRQEIKQSMIKRSKDDDVTQGDAPKIKPALGFPYLIIFCGSVNIFTFAIFTNSCERALLCLHQQMKLRPVRVWPSYCLRDTNILKTEITISQ